jgi:thiol-disulfide isomerase/thioredoxin
MRKWAVIIWLVALSGGIVAFFWYNDWVYSLPTPVPKNYMAVNMGERINAATEFNLNKNNKPVFLHFFNPDCPCSRFNIPHFKSLVNQYGNKVNFAIVIMSKKKFSAKEIQEKFDLNIPVLFDSSIAIQCGVYSTPQAVILDAGEKLFYRGNYNKSRYCTDTKSNYAEIALDSLLHDKTAITFNQFALRAYGCQLPNCTR